MGGGDKWLALLEKEEFDVKKDSENEIDGLKNEILVLESKLDKLLDSHLEDIVDRGTYLAKKVLLLSQKIDKQEKIGRIHKHDNGWLEPMRDFVITLNNTKKIASDSDLLSYPTFLKKIGSNFILKEKKLQILTKKDYRFALEIDANSCLLGGRDSNPDSQDQNLESYH